jgi:hypothetical protein
MRYHEILRESREASLYHGYKKPEHARMALEANEMLGTTTQRWWPNGVELVPEDDPKYRESYWMKGISLTRDLSYAAHWGDIIFELDQRALSYNYKIIPFNWMRGRAQKYSVNDTQSDVAHFRKGEREEFLILEKGPNNYMFPKDPEFDDYPEYEPRLDLKAFKTPANKKLAPLSRYLKAIYVEPYFMNKYPETYDYQYFIDHPKFGGFKSFPRRK